MKLERWHVIHRAIDRGYDVHSIWPCFVGFVKDDIWEVDVDHPAYPKKRGPEPEPVVRSIGEGAGTELKKILKFFGIEASEGCSCNARAEEMNVRGLEWCTRNVPVITGWLQEEAAKRSLPFSHLAASLLVKRAISNARKANNK